MRTAFLLAILFVAASYTYMAFANLAFLSSTGRLGPGFFPRVIGVLLVVMCLYSLYADLSARREQGERSSYAGLVVLVAVLSGIFVALLNVLGGVLAMALFLLVSLSILNRRGPIVNVAASVVLPICVYLLFDYWLNASMPAGMLPLPV